MATAAACDDDLEDYVTDFTPPTEDAGDNEDWMKNLPTKLHDLSLTQLAIPGKDT